MNPYVNAPSRDRLFVYGYALTTPRAIDTIRPVAADGKLGAGIGGSVKIAVMGTGGLGGYFGGQMAHAGLDVTFIAGGRHMEAIRDNGLQVNTPGGDFLVQPARVSDKHGEVGAVHLMLFCVKADDARAA